MSKISFLLFLLFGFLFIYPQTYGLVYAQQLPIEITPKELSSQNTSGVDIQINNLKSQSIYFARMQFNGGVEGLINLGGVDTRGNNTRPDTNGTIFFHLCGTGSQHLDKYTVADTCNGKTFDEGTHTIKLYESNYAGQADLVATGSFNVYIETVGKIEFQNTSFTTNDEIVIKVSGISDGSHKIMVDGKDPVKGGACVDAKNGSFTQNIGQYYEAPQHTVQIYKNNLPNNPCGAGTLITYGTFPISNTTLVQPGPAVGSGTTSPATTINVKQCKQGDPACTSGGGDPCDTQDNRGPAFKTAIGCVHTNPAEFVKDLMTWVLGIGGGLAFLMMLLGAFQMLTSAGNPETLAAGKDRLTSAVIGLLFVIFAILLLQIIGVGILNLPGFK